MNQPSSHTAATSRTTEQEEHSTVSIHITAVHAVEILDSRGRPTLSVSLQTADGTSHRAGVPSGASTGSGEAVELRDGDAARYGGKGVRTAAGNVNHAIHQTLAGRSFADLAELDQTLIDLDATTNKSALGANAIVGVSMAAARAFAAAAGTSLWQYLTPSGVTPVLPVPHFNVVNGGAHAPNSLDFQEFMLAPLGAPTYAEAVRAGAEVYAALKARLSKAGYATGLGDEGGFAPDIAKPEDVLATLVDAITDAGYTPGRDGVAIALDPAASEFYRGGRYHVAGHALSSAEMIGYYSELVGRFPIWSIEDGLAEDDADGWVRLTEALGGVIQLVGDDNFVTNPSIIAEAISRGVANAALIKVNQIGSVTETLEAIRLCRDAGYGAMISHRSGETEDSFIADLAVGSGCGQLKSGAPARGERVAKYNRLLEIADENRQLAFHQR
jgi:enolase